MMTKTELVELLESTEIPVNEAISSKINTNVFPRIVFWDYIWEEVSASNNTYNTSVTYQISVHHLEPRPIELLKLRKNLHALGIRPTIYKEFIQDEREFHSYFAIEVLENLDLELDDEDV